MIKIKRITNRDELDIRTLFYLIENLPRIVYWPHDMFKKGYDYGVNDVEKLLETLIEERKENL